MSQAQSLEKNLYNLYDNLTQTQNNEVYNGLEYVDLDRRLSPDDHKFYGSFNLIPGSVIYNRQPYYNLKLKYDLLEDVVVVHFIDANHIRLNSKLVTSFAIGDNNAFVRLPFRKSLASFYGHGFFKEAYKGNGYSLYIKYIKKKVEKIKDQKIYSVFNDSEVYVIQNGETFFEASRIKEVTKAIPEKEDLIKLFYKNYSRLYRSNRRDFLVRLLKSLDN
ncbi:hypothetical protein GCM10022395_12980 [Snuella lapsa]|uniref:Uncharacterized protein n=1 Tax=Snuella lapsa TaxID=870481 RepID=A0ABP6X9Y6_9FLAO